MKRQHTAALERLCSISSFTIKKATTLKSNPETPLVLHDRGIQVRCDTVNQDTESLDLPTVEAGAKAAADAARDARIATLIIMALLFRQASKVASENAKMLDYVGQKHVFVVELCWEANL